MSLNLSERLRFWQVSGQERAFLFRSLGVMFNSGCSLVHALDMLGQQLQNRVLAESCANLARQLQGGHYLSNAMQKLPWAFTPVQISMIQIGEKSGQLAQVLLKLADHEERQLELKLKVRNALTMPLIICSVCLLMVLVIPPLLFGGIFQILRETGGQLPPATRLLMGFNRFLCSGLCPLFALLLLLGGAALLHHWRRSPEFQVAVQRRLLKVAGLGTVLRLMWLTRFAGAFETLIEVGVGVLPALKLAGQACDCAYLRQGLEAVAEQVREGESLADSFAAFDFFPPAFVQSLAAGEESGRLTRMVASLGQLYRVELEHALDLLSKSLEPIVLGLVGGIVCFVVVATLAPMLKLVESL